MNSITPAELKSRLDSGEEIQIIDIREIEERDICALNSEHIPMEDLQSSLQRIRRDILVIIHCKAGQRAEAAVHLLRLKHKLQNVFNLEGGIIGWAENVDPKMATY